MNSKLLLYSYLALSFGAGVLALLFIEILNNFENLLLSPLLYFLHGGGVFCFIFLTHFFGQMIIREEFKFNSVFFYKLFAGILVFGCLFMFAGLLYDAYENGFGKFYLDCVEIFIYAHFYPGIFFLIELGRVKMSKLIKRAAILFAMFLFFGVFGVFVLKEILGIYYVPSMILGATVITIMSVYLFRYYFRKNWLVILNGPKAGKDFPLLNDIIFIGNQKDDDINLSEYLDVNPSHAKIIRYGNADLFSFVDNDPFSRSWINFRASRDQILNNRDIITLGSAKLMFCSKD